MTAGWVAALAGYAFVTSVTPGPNKMMLMASGANFGLRRTVPHMLGVALGFGVMVLLLGVGLDGVLAARPRVMDALRLAGMGYMLWLAWKIATAAPPGAATAPRARPLGFLQAAAFQWVNPKAWAMALGALAAYAAGIGGPFGGALWVAVVFVAVNLPSVAVWAALGQALRRWLQHPGRLRAFNLTMAVLLVAAMLPVLLPGILG